MAKLCISDPIFQTFPDVLIGVVVFQGVENKGANPEIIALLGEEEAAITRRFAGISISDHPQIAPWREAYRKFGAKPKDHQSSIENLVRRVTKGHHVTHINLVVDIYNTVSLRYIVPVGGEDLDRIVGDVELTFATEHEPPVRLLGEQEERSPKPGEVIYKDQIGAICRRWNWKEADRTKFTEETRNGILIVEGLPPVERRIVQQVIDELTSLVSMYCGGTVRNEILSASTPEMLL
jgi:DNA/RNA-binding domain of Phe-tRNA-synthetase-like protein